MPKYFATYKCHLCGAPMRLKDSFQANYDDLPRYLGKVVFNQNFINNPALYEAPMHLPHKCADGSCGMAIFAGFKKEKE